MTNKIIEVQNIKVNITNMNDSDYICISDFTYIVSSFNVTGTSTIKWYPEYPLGLGFLI